MHSKKNKKIDDDAKLCQMPEEWSTDLVAQTIDDKITEERGKQEGFKASQKLGSIIMK